MLRARTLAPQDNMTRRNENERLFISVAEAATTIIPTTFVIHHSLPDSGTL